MTDFQQGAAGGLPRLSSSLPKSRHRVDTGGALRWGRSRGHEPTAAVRLPAGCVGDLRQIALAGHEGKYLRRARTFCRFVALAGPSLPWRAVAGAKVRKFTEVEDMEPAPYDVGEPRASDCSRVLNR